MTYQFKIQLAHIDHPKVWRRVIVPGQLSFSDFHYVIQAAFGWDNVHAYQFSPKGYGSRPQIGLTDADWDRNTLDATKLFLYDVFKKPEDKFVYIYDFGDDWTHHIELEKIIDDDTLYPRCIDGKGACPPEDCGGPRGYEELKRILADKTHPEHGDMREWLGLQKDETWDANYFDPDGTATDNNLFGFPSPSTYNQVEVIPEKMEQTDKAPVFTHPELEVLYRSDSNIDRQLLQHILELPRKTLIEDLEKMLVDCIARYDYFYNRDWDESSHSFPLHAVILLSVLQAEEALPAFFSLLRQSEELLDYWFTDLLTEDFWRYAYAMGQNRLDDFKKFLFEPNRYVFARGVLSTTVVQIAVHQPDRKDEAIAWFEDVIQGLVDKKDDKNVFDTTHFSMLVCDLTNIGSKEQLPFIEQCYEQDLVSEFEAGTLEEARKYAVGPIPEHEIFKVYATLDQYYDDWRRWYNEDDDFPDALKKDQYPLFTKPYIAPPKVGRNDPCPCGSGKKYKKCCGAK